MKQKLFGALGLFAFAGLMFLNVQVGRSSGDSSVTLTSTANVVLAQGEATGGLHPTSNQLFCPGGGSCFSTGCTTGTTTCTPTAYDCCPK